MEGCDLRLLPSSFVLFLLFFAPVVSATDIFFTPHELSVEPGALFDVTIWVSPTETIDTVATDLIYWNPAVMECVSITHGDLFQETTIWIPGTIDNEKGNILNMVWASSTPVNNTSGTYVILGFKAKQATTTIVVAKEKCGVARIGVPVSFQIKNACVVNVGGSIGLLSLDDATLYIIITAIIIFMIIVSTAVYVRLHPNKKK